jgi:hypothetical protein
VIVLVVFSPLLRKAASVMHYFKKRIFMNRQIVIILCFTVFISSCNTKKSQQETNYIPADTTISFKIDNYWLTPKKSFDFNSLGNSTGDTLDIVTCSDYAYFPFGQLTNKKSLAKSLLKDFIITEFKRDTFTNLDVSPNLLWYESMNMQLGENKLSLSFDNDPEATMHGYINSGQIVNDKVVFYDNIKIGISIDEFYSKFFDYFPAELKPKYKVVKLETCVTDYVHIYTFDNGKLSNVKFVSLHN